jgi:hypothetical protein
MMVTKIDFSGTQIVNFGTGPTILLNPLNPVPVDGRTTITASWLMLGTPVNVHTPASDLASVPLVEFRCSNTGGINDNVFEFVELNGAAAALLFDNPPVGISTRGNYIVCANVHDQVGTTYNVIQMGTGSTTRILENVIVAPNVQIGVATKRGLDIWGQCKIFYGNIFQVGISTGGYCVVFESSADGNQIYAGRLDGQGGRPSYFDGSSPNRNLVVSENFNRLQEIAIPTAATTNIVPLTTTPHANDRCTIVLTADATGGGLITWDASLKGTSPDDIDNGPNKVNIYEFIGLSDGNWHLVARTLGE